MPELYKSKKECFGCEACMFACENHAVTMEADEEGFYYPRIDEDVCVGCGRCEEVCPAKHPLPAAEISCYSVRCREESLLKASTSGGAFSLIASEVIRNGGKVCGAVFNEEFRVVHSVSNDIAPMRKSKYVQSRAGECYEDLKAALQQGIPVLFTGTPCQCHAVKQMFSGYENLITAGLICRGVLSPKLWEEYKTYLKRNGELTAFCFRDKRLDNDAHTVAYTAGGKEYTSVFMKDPLCRIYSKELPLRPSCYQCPYSTAEKLFDFTIGDFWGVENVFPELADGKGTSLVLACGERAEKMMQDLKKTADVRNIQLEEAMQPALKEPPKEGFLRKFLFKDLKTAGPDGHCNMELILKKYGF